MLLNAPLPAVYKQAFSHCAIFAMGHTLNPLMSLGARYRMPVKKPNCSPFTVLALVSKPNNDLRIVGLLVFINSLVLLVYIYY